MVRNNIRTACDVPVNILHPVRQLNMALNRTEYVRSEENNLKNASPRSRSRAMRSNCKRVGKMDLMKFSEPQFYMDREGLSLNVTLFKAEISLYVFCIA